MSDRVWQAGTHKQKTDDGQPPAGRRSLDEARLTPPTDLLVRGATRSRHRPPPRCSLGSHLPVLPARSVGSPLMPLARAIRENGLLAAAGGVTNPSGNEEPYHTYGLCHSVSNSRASRPAELETESMGTPGSTVHMSLFVVITQRGTHIPHAASFITPRWGIVRRHRRRRRPRVNCCEPGGAEHPPGRGDREEGRAHLPARKSGGP